LVRGEGAVGGGDQRGNFLSFIAGLREDHRWAFRGVTQAKRGPIDWHRAENTDYCVGRG